MVLLIMSDVHGNQAALESVLDYVNNKKSIDAFILLGDLIDYGMHSNETIRMIKNLQYPIICNILGNHEQAILTDDYRRFSSERGKTCAQYTRNILSLETWDYIKHTMSGSGTLEFSTGEKKCLAVHGSIDDIYWKSITPNQDLSVYQEYDYVFSGHSHLPHFFEVFYKANNFLHRNRKKTLFINPGSVGQPRNINPMAQFAIFDTDNEELLLKKIPYDIKKEQSAYIGQVDVFYKERLEYGV